MSFSNCTFLVIIYHFLFGFSFALFLWGHEPRRWASSCSLGSSELPTRLGGTFDLGEPLPSPQNRPLPRSLEEPPPPLRSSEAPPASTIASSRSITTSDMLFGTSFFGSNFFLFVSLDPCVVWVQQSSVKIPLNHRKLDARWSSRFLRNFFGDSTRSSANSGLNDFKNSVKSKGFFPSNGSLISTRPSCPSWSTNTGNFFFSDKSLVWISSGPSCPSWSLRDSTSKCWKFREIRLMNRQLILRLEQSPQLFGSNVRLRQIPDNPQLLVWNPRLQII